MLKKKYSIYTTEEYPFDQMCQSLLSQIGTESDVIKIVFFGLPKNNEEYLSELQILSRCMSEYFPEKRSLISYAAQEPFKCKLSAEVMSIASSQSFSTSFGDNYIVLDNGICRELITGGILPPDISASHSIQSNAVFAQIEEILFRENFPINSIVRQWNYIENISLFNGEYQNYQEFNDSRSYFYAKTDWNQGYPAATGIGTYSGGVMVEVIAVTGAVVTSRALDNPLQVAAYKYSQAVLHGATYPFFKQHTSPKFERAHIVRSNNRETIYISGTAAIRGEASVITDDIIEQTLIIMQNIDYLISSKNYPANFTSLEFQILRIYVKNKSQMEEVSNYVNANYPELKFLLVCADICREELLLEIEGIALVIQ